MYAYVEVPSVSLVPLLHFFLPTVHEVNFFLPQPSYA